MIQTLLDQRIPVAIISDCVGTDRDAELRLSMSIQSLLGMTPTMRHTNHVDLLAFLMMDCLTRCVRPGVVIGNIAPRHGAHHYQNGIPFAYTRLKNGHLAVCTAQPEAFSGFKMLGVLPREGIRVVDTRKALLAMVKAGFLRKGLVNSIANSQFRSLDFQPLLAAAILLGIKIPTQTVISCSEVPDLENAVAYDDHFGNLKLWIKESATKKFKNGKNITLKIAGRKHSVPFYRQLRNVPNNSLAYIVGSSGSYGNHFCELVINGKSAAKKLGLKIGHKIKIVT